MANAKSTRKPVRKPTRKPTRRPPRRRADEPARERQRPRAPRELPAAERPAPAYDKPPPRQSLAHRGGHTVEKGEPQLSALLASAMRAAETAPGDELTHGFHTHPARMHPAIPDLLIPELSAPGSIVLDPFCGSGTVLVEAMVHGRRAAGVDLDPIAVRIAEQQCALRDGPSRSRFGALLRAISAASEERVRSRAEVEVSLPPWERAFYDPHVMLELSGLHAEIKQVQDEVDRRALELVFSAILVKFSRQRADTNEELVKKRIRKGLATEFFARKGQELILRWAALAEAVPEGTEPARVFQGDARQLPEILGPRMRTSFVLTSPPYGGTYDYARHHARRHAFLGIDARGLAAREVGARRTHSSEDAEPRRWDAEMHAVLESITQVLSRDGRIVFFVGDAEVGRTRIEADQQLARLAPRHGLALVASAAQPRPDFRSGRTRHEHLVLMQRAR